MKSICKISSSIFASLILALLLLPNSVTAHGDFDLAAFDATIVLSVDGTFTVVETIVIDFHVPRHGIYRVIPTVYSVDEETNRILTIDNINVTDELGVPRPTEASLNDGLYLKIGDPDVTVEGEQTYVITYRVAGALQSFEAFDELFWNVTGTEWDEPPAKATATVILPAEIDPAAVDLKPYCYTGSYGAKEANCTIEVEGQEVRFSTANNFLTIAVGWPQGLISVPEPNLVPASGASSTGGPSDARWYWGLSLLLPLATLILMFRHWRRHGRDPKGRGTIVPEYDPPANLRPSEMGIVMDNHLSATEISAAIVDLAVRGHLKIREVVEERFGPDKRTYAIEKLEAADSLKVWEKNLLAVMFEAGETAVTESDLKQRLPKHKSAIEEALYHEVVELGYYKEHPYRARTAWLIAGGTVFWMGWLFTMFAPALVPTGLILVFFGALMPRRTELGVKTMEHAKGFRMFLETAEKYRLQWQEREGIFEKFLPYAMVFGVAKKWAEAFAAVHATSAAPAWYVGVHAFNPIAFSDSIGNLSRSMATAIAPKGSGSGGGGFSGGGFGGGGGGSW